MCISKAEYNIALDSGRVLTDNFKVRWTILTYLM